MRNLIIFVLILLSACGMQSQLSRDFNGKDLQFIEHEFNMKVAQLYEIENGFTKAVFVKSEKIGSTIINQGEATLDPIRSPSVLKTEYFTFTLNELGQVIKSEYKKEYAQN